MGAYILHRLRVMSVGVESYENEIDLERFAGGHTVHTVLLPSVETLVSTSNSKKVSALCHKGIAVLVVVNSAPDGQHSTTGANHFVSWEVTIPCPSMPSRAMLWCSDTEMLICFKGCLREKKVR